MGNIDVTKAAITAFFAGLSAFLGWFGWLIVLFVVTMAVDYATGTAAAMKCGEWSSSVARTGLWHKAGEIVAVAVAAGTDFLLMLMAWAGEHMMLIDLPFEYKVLICPIVLVWYILTELGSIIENAGRLTNNIPPFLMKMIKVFKNAAEQGGEKVAKGK